MTTTTLTKDNFETTVAGDDIVLVDFWALVVRPVPPVRADLRGGLRGPRRDVVFGKVDTEAERGWPPPQITSIPTLMAFREGVLVFAQPGALPAPALEQVIQAVRDLDMEDVHAQVAAQQQGDRGSDATDDRLHAHGHAPRPHETAVADVRAALADQGFGVLTEIDLRATLAAKLGVEVAPQVILGAWPPLAHRALEIDPSVATMLPCNVVVRAVDEDTTVVEAFDPGRDDRPRR